MKVSGSSSLLAFNSAAPPLNVTVGCEDQTAMSLGILLLAVGSNGFDLAHPVE